jgi:hypothetical protein
MMILGFSGLDPHEQSSAWAESASEVMRLESGPHHKREQPRARDHESGVALLEMTKPLRAFPYEVVNSEARMVSPSLRVRQPDESDERALVRHQVEVPRVKLGRVNPWFHDGETAGPQMARDVGERGLNVSFGREVTNRAEKAAHDIERPPKVEPAHVTLHESNAGKSLARDPEHRRTSVDPGDRVLPS